MTVKVTEFVVDRKTWLRGEGPDESTLYRPRDGKMCCLGFYSLACGLHVEDITLVSAVAQLAKDKIDPQLEWLTLFSHKDSELALGLMGANDNNKTVCVCTEEELDRNCGCTCNTGKPLLGEGDRERIITEIFAGQGIAVNFIN